MSSCLLVFLLAASAPADTIQLKDGSKLEGTIRREPGGWVITDAAGKARHVGDEAVLSLEKSGSRSSTDLAEAALASLRRSAEGLNDASQAIARYTRFIEQHKNTPAAAEAQKELEVWKDRQTRGMVKVGSAWMTPQEVAAFLEKSIPLIDEARNLLRQGRLRDTETLLAKLLTADPKSVAGLYLQGLLCFKQGQLAPAKKAFERVRDLLPDHAPTLNNLAVIAFQQKQPLAALTFYDQALLIGPLNRQILDNIAEALHALPAEHKDSAQAKKLAKRFAQMDQDLQRQLAGEGLTRWGATFVTSAQMDEVRKAQKLIDEKTDALKKDYDRLKDQVAQIDRDIASNERIMFRMRQDRFRMDAQTGAMIELPLPLGFWELVQDNDKLKAEQRRLLQQIQGFDAQARLIQQQTPIPAYTGQQRLIDVEGTPMLLPPKPPSTQPTL